MILTCPECATRYSVADDKVGPQGKAVRCAKCSCRWTAYPEAEIELVAEVAAPEPAAFAAPAEAAAPPPAAAAVIKPAPQVFRERARASKTMREAVVTGMVWAGLGAFSLMLVCLCLIFRVDVVRMLPRAASAYAAVGLPVNATGLVFEDISAKPALQDGHAALVVSGVVRNIEKRPIHAPAIHIKVLDKAGKAVAAKLTHGPESPIAPGRSHHFVVAVLDPPAAADDVEVSFADKPHGKAGKAKGHGPAAGHGDPHAAPAKDAHGAPAHAPEHAALRGPAAPDHAAAAHAPAPSPAPVQEAMEARPLPPGSPYALHTPHG